MSGSGGLTGDWDKALKMLNPAYLKQTLTRAANRAGVFASGEIKRGITSQAPDGKQFAPLHPFTIAQKKSSKALIDHSDLRNSATYEVLSPTKILVGVKKVVQGKNGPVDIAAVHEYGCTIRVTDKMRGYLHSQGLHLKKTTQFIRIPERSFLRATLNDQAFRRKLEGIYTQAITEAFA